MIYDYLFYKGHQLAKKSKNWEDTPMLFSIMIISWCIILNLGTLLFLIEGLNNKGVEFGGIISFLNNYRYIFGGVVVLLIWLYYAYKGRWKRVVAKYESREKERTRNIHPVIVVIAAYVVSFLLGMFAAMYKNGDGIFA
ncbi:MAG: hypothetical protein R2831_02180 [Chitinophagaceae bacterium]